MFLTSVNKKVIEPFANYFTVTGMFIIYRKMVRDRGFILQFPNSEKKAKFSEQRFYIYSIPGWLGWHFMDF